LIVTKEQSRLTEEEARDVRRELDHSKETLRDVGTHVIALEYKVDTTLREAQDVRHASKVKFVEVVEFLRQCQAESESPMARAEAVCTRATYSVSYAHISRYH
jgi:hypothetical protein